MNRTAEILRQLRRYESRNVTFVQSDGTWPIVWERAQGVHVWDAAGRRYLDLTAAFGVAAAGHANPRVVHAGQRQMARLLHAMGDVHPHALKARLARELSRITFEHWPVAANASSRLKSGKTIFCNSGFEAVEAALKTAMLATGKSGIVAFEGGYHGLGYGALNATHRDFFRTPFRRQLGEFAHFVKFPKSPAEVSQVENAIRRLCSREKIGAVLVEPIQVRGGINIPPANFLPALRLCCNATGALLILDEIYTGFGRTGNWFACEARGIAPDIICLGKALTGGFPLSACVGRSALMDSAWPESSGEAIHTSTFLGHPVGCAMALAQIAEIRRRRLVARSRVLGGWLSGRLSKLQFLFPELIVEARGAGLLAGLELRRADGSPASDIAGRIVREMLRLGFILLPEGEHGNVISFTPPLTITRVQLDTVLGSLERLLRDAAGKMARPGTRTEAQVAIQR